MSLWIYGINPVSSVLQKRPRDVKEIIFIKTLDDKKENERLVILANKSKALNIKTRTLSYDQLPAELDEKGNANHQRIFALIESPKLYELKELLADDRSDKFFLMLDGITDVHNIGAIIRTAAALGVDAIILPKDRSVTITADVYKTSSGAVEDVKIVNEVNLVRCVELLKEKSFWVYGFEAEGTQNIYDADLKGNVCCVVGGEDTGIRRLLKENCDLVLKIPMKGKINSLNASVSSAIVIYEVLRQRTK